MPVLRHRNPVISVEEEGQGQHDTPDLRIGLHRTSWRPVAADLFVEPEEVQRTVLLLEYLLCEGERKASGLDEEPQSDSEVLRAVQLEEKRVPSFDGPEGATARPLEVYLIRIRFASFLSALLSSLSEMLVNVLCRFRQVQGPCGAMCPDIECFLVALSDINREGAGISSHYADISATNGIELDLDEW